MDPLRAVGVIRRWDNGVTDGYFGTCFAYKWQNRFVTAAHCVAGIDRQHIAIQMASGLIITISDLIVHPSADIAVMSTAGIQVQGFETEPFTDAVSQHYLGEDAMAYGYPIDVLGPSGNGPVPRIFKGYFQRFIQEYQAYTGYKYLAGEVNFACPKGLSGGPFFRQSVPHAVFGVATENLRSTTTVDAIETTSSATGVIEKVEYHEVISYGTVLMLSGVSDWLDRWCPPREKDARPASLGVSLRADE